MAEIYSNSFCNIAATAATDGSQGCFQTTDYHEANQEPKWLEIRFESDWCVMISSFDKELSEMAIGVDQKIR